MYWKELVPSAWIHEFLPLVRGSGTNRRIPPAMDIRQKISDARIIVVDGPLIFRRRRSGQGRRCAESAGRLQPAARRLRKRTEPPCACAIARDRQPQPLPPVLRLREPSTR
jgi:hypothetical protein